MTRDTRAAQRRWYREVDRPRRGMQPRGDDDKLDRMLTTRGARGYVRCHLLRLAQTPTEDRIELYRPECGALVFVGREAQHLLEVHGCAPSPEALATFGPVSEVRDTMVCAVLGDRGH